MSALIERARLQADRLGVSLGSCLSRIGVASSNEDGQDVSPGALSLRQVLDLAVTLHLDAAELLEGYLIDTQPELVEALVTSGLMVRGVQERSLLQIWRHSLSDEQRSGSAENFLPRSAKTDGDRSDTAFFELRWRGAVQLPGQAEVVEHPSLRAPVVRVDGVGAWIPFVAWHRVREHTTKDDDDTFRGQIALDLVEEDVEIIPLNADAWAGLTLAENSWRTGSGSSQ